jgi:hypothetical protein
MLNTAFPGPGARKKRTTEVARLKREFARVTEERDILKRPRCPLSRSCDEARLHSRASPGVSCDTDVSSTAGQSEWFLCLAAAPGKSADPGPDHADAWPPSADARGLRRPQDAATPHLRRPGLRSAPGGAAPAARRHRALRRRRDVRTMQVHQHKTPTIPNRLNQQYKRPSRGAVKTHCMLMQYVAGLRWESLLSHFHFSMPRLTAPHVCQAWKLSKARRNPRRPAYTGQFEPLDKTRVNVLPRIISMNSCN